MHLCMLFLCIPCLLDFNEYLVKKASQLFAFRFLVRVSYLEIYNEEVRDLLGKDQSQRLEVSLLFWIWCLFHLLEQDYCKDQRAFEGSREVGLLSVCSVSFEIQQQLDVTMISLSLFNLLCCTVRKWLSAESVSSVQFSCKGLLAVILRLSEIWNLRFEICICL